MPIYEYECDACRDRVEILQRLDEAPLGHCPRCGGTMRKLLSAPAFQFKGSGWYVTDYAKGSGAAPAKAANGAAAGGEKPEEKPGDKPAEKPAERTAERPAAAPPEGK